MRQITCSVNASFSISSLYIDNTFSAGTSTMTDLVAENVTTTDSLVVGTDGIKGGCIAGFDVDLGGWTFCRFLNGEMLCNTTDCTGNATSSIVVGDDA